MQPLPNPGVRIPPPLLFVAGLLGGWALARTWPLAIVGVGAGRAAAGAGVALVALGVLLLIWAGATFRRAGTAIIPFYPASRIVDTGPFRFTRNPMYVGFTLAYVGVALLMNRVAPLVLLPLVLGALYLTVIRLEERYLASAFGEVYEAYRRRVRRWI